MLGDRRPVLRLEKGQLGAEQTNAVGPCLERGAHLRRGRGVGEDPNRPPVTGHRRQGSRRHRSSSRCAAADIAPRTVSTRARPVTAMTTLRSPSTMHDLPLVQPEQFQSDADHHRQPEPPGNDRRMAGDAPVGESDPAHVAVELDDVCGPEIRSDEDRVAAVLPLDPTGPVRDAGGRRADRGCARPPPARRAPRHRACRAAPRPTSTSTRIALAALRPRLSTALSTASRSTGSSAIIIPASRMSASSFRPSARSRRRQLLELARRSRQRVEGTCRRSRTRAARQGWSRRSHLRRPAAVPSRTLSPVTPERQRALARSFQGVLATVRSRARMIIAVDVAPGS